MIEYLATERRTGYIQYESPSRPGSARDYTSYPALEATSVRIPTPGNSGKHLSYPAPLPPGSDRDHLSYPALE